MLRLIRIESGNATAIALGVLVVTGVLSASVFSVSARLGDTSNASRDTKRALAAADAGIEAALYRMNKQNLQDTQSCFTTQLTAPTAGECPGFSENLGNGTSYTYFVTPALDADDRCAGLPVQTTNNTGTVAVVQRCITAIGEAGREARRVQTRAAAYIGLSLMDLGIKGRDRVSFDNSAVIDSWVGSNGQIEFGNSSSADGLEIAPSAPDPILGDSTSAGPIIRRTAAQGPHVLSPVDVGDSATVNDNARITNGLDQSKNVSFNAATRELTLGNSSSITLGGGTYNFCKLRATNSAKINIAAGVKTRIFIDSPDREGSGCAAGTGTFVGENSVEFTNVGPAENLQIYVYGRPESGNGALDVHFKNSFNFNKGFIYAPNSPLEFKNSVNFYGAIVGKTIDFKNSVNFHWEPSLSSMRAETLSMYYPSAWKECRSRQTSPTDPESGCQTS